eukprot:10264091-Alexandrium_andersonii.AAC.1
MSIFMLATRLRDSVVVRTSHVGAHVGDPWNETVDTLATLAISDVPALPWPCGIGVSDMARLRIAHAIQSLCQQS